MTISLPPRPDVRADLTDRPRRTRRTPALRSLTREISLSAAQFIYPMFIHEGQDEQPIASMPGVSRYSVAGAVARVGEALSLGVNTVVLFGIPNSKDAQGTQAYADQGIVQVATRAIKAAHPGVSVIADTCLCEYTDHGHCGPLCEIGGEVTVDNDAALELLAHTAVSQARAGADIVAPSAMMDGQIGAIRTALDAAGFTHVPVMSYAVKYASAYYGPFRDAAGSTPSFGNRGGYQMDPAGGQARRRAGRGLPDGQAGAALPGRDPGDPRRLRPASGGLQRVGRVRDGQGRRGRWHARRAAHRAGDPDLVQARRGRRHHDLPRPGRRPLAARGRTGP